MNEKNAGYTIKEEISLMGSTYVLGEKPESPSPYVTWAKGPTGGYAFGHYFADEDSARQDLLTRAILDMPEAQVDKLALSILSEDALEQLHRQEREDNAMTDIEFCLDDALENLHISAEDKTPLLKNPEFRSEALRVFWNQDHSYENEALTESLEILIKDKFPQYLPEPSVINNPNAVICFSVGWDVDARKFCVNDQRLGSLNMLTRSGSYDTFAEAYEAAREKAQSLFNARAKWNDVGLTDPASNKQALIGSWGMSKAQEQGLRLSPDEIYQNIEDQVTEQLQERDEIGFQFIDVCAEQKLDQPGYRLVVWGEENDTDDKFFSVSVYQDDKQGHPDQQILNIFSESEELSDLKSCIVDVLSRFEEKLQSKEPQHKSLDEQVNDAKTRAEQGSRPDQSKPLER